MRKCRWLHVALVAMCCAAPALSWGLGLGEIEVESALNERFSGRIDVLDAQGFGKSELVVSMASREDYERVGVERFFYLTYLEFEVGFAADGSAHVNVTSSQAISEPYLNFIVEVMWPKGRLLKEYTVLLDPPTYTQAFAPSVAAPTQRVAVAPERPKAPQPAAAERSTRVRVTPAPAAAGRPSGVASEDSVITTRDDTLWRIASRTLGSDRVTVHQQMLAFQRKNPGAFIRDNINLLKAGHVLEIPTEPEALATSHAMAFADVAEQAAAWRENRPPRRQSPVPTEAIAATPEQPEVQLASQVDATPQRRENRTGADDGSGEVRILANPGDMASETAAGADASMSQLIEEKETLSRQVDELSYQLDREKEIAANQVTVKDRQLEVKDQEIAQLQEQLRERREALEQLLANQNQNQNTTRDAAETPWWMSPMAMFGGIGVLILILVLLGIRVRRSRAAAVTTSPTGGPVAYEPEPLATASPAALYAAGDEAAADFMEDDEFETDLLEPGIGDAVDSELDTLDVEEHSPIEEMSEDVSETAAADDSAMFGQTGDVIGEAEIYIAYGRFGQAVNLLGSFLENEPERHDVRLKLLEVFVESNDEAGFEEHARYLADNCDDPDTLQAFQQLEEQLRDGVIDLSSESGEELAQTDDTEVYVEASESGEVTLDDLEELDGESSGLDEFELEFEADIQTALDEAETSARDDPGGDLGIDFDPETNIDGELPAATESEALDLDDLDDLVSELADISVEPDNAQHEARSDDESTADDEAVIELASAGGGEEDEFDFDVGEFDVGEDVDINATKLDLAEAYIDMGDADGAHEILKEVLEEGTPEQRAKAQEMLEGIA